MPTIKDILKGPNIALRNAEANLPAGLPRVSAALDSVFASLPSGPAVPGAAAPSAFPQPLRVTEFIKSVESGLPAGSPKLSQAAEGLAGISIFGQTGGATPAEVAPAPVKAPKLVFE